jgi:hypothetical protein
MNTLTTPPLATLLAQLFADADTTKATLMAKLSSEELDAIKGSGNYREVYAEMKDFHLAVSQETGAFSYGSGLGAELNINTKTLEVNDG